MAIEPRTACEVGYEARTVYEARVETGDKILFMFYHAPRASHIQIKRSDVSDSGWLDYLLIPDVDLHYHTPNGVWILHTPKECNPTWLFKVETEVKKGLFYTPVIIRVSNKAVVHNVVHTTPYGGRYYSTRIEDDMVDAFGYAVTANKDVEKEVKQVTEWYKRTQGIDFANPLQPKIKFTSKKEVKNKMLQLIDVIFFNRKTKKIDFRREIVAVDMEEAYMLAAQEYGKYDSKVHMRHANCLFSFCDDDKE